MVLRLSRSKCIEKKKGVTGVEEGWEGRGAAVVLKRLKVSVTETFHSAFKKVEV